MTVVAIAVIAMLDYVTGRTVSFNGLYMLILCFVAWTQGERIGLAGALLCCSLSISINGFGDGHSVLGTTLPAWNAAWNAGMRLVTQWLIVFAVGGMRHYFDQQHMLARIDPLTGLLNKRAFFEQARESLIRAERKHQSAVLAYVDLDGFKAVNDRFGHAAGDTVLRRFAEAATGKLRPNDLAGRIGGDEFVFLLHVPNGATGASVAERIHARLSNCLVDAPCHVSCSTGAIVIEEPGRQDGEVLARLADTLMYEVKRDGKDGVRIAMLSTVPAEPLKAAFPPIEDESFAGLIARLDAVAAMPCRDAA